jgi:predicted transcriptional regulator
MEKEKLYPTSVRLPERVKQELEKIAEKETRSLSNLLLRAAMEYIENHKDS